MVVVGVSVWVAGSGGEAGRESGSMGPAGMMTVSGVLVVGSEMAGCLGASEDLTGLLLWRESLLLSQDETLPWSRLGDVGASSAVVVGVVPVAIGWISRDLVSVFDLVVDGSVGSSTFTTAGLTSESMGATSTTCGVTMGLTRMIGSSGSFVGSSAVVSGFGSAIGGVSRMVSGAPASMAPKAGIASVVVSAGSSLNVSGSVMGSTAIGAEILGLCFSSSRSLFSSAFLAFSSSFLALSSRFSSSVKALAKLYVL